MDMIGQQFDELWAYIKALSTITDRQSDLTEGFSKDLLPDLTIHHQTSATQIGIVGCGMTT